MATNTKEQPRQTLEQLRAQDAWDKAGDGIARHGKDYVNDAKGLPALIMNSGLMQVVAYLQDKGGRHDTLGQHLRQWLRRRFPQQITGDDFPSFMQSLLKMKEPGDYQAITAEAFAWLRWLRQMAAARNGDNNA
ncbi:type III-B CRISPR module-associated protein Cmr5 [Accumulibacter sp.]|jgi:CRISPR-associated protein Cmr5|uniref:type III-B CRISPR module-associated protein Cmr5 n=1 Tax=Accumulibacter sp. TaxID=2053492 RepID=UPI001D7D422D|nr:type III-B CRISPR module-associated protein Cmr5 [Accumulibacter sp.]MCB1618258.1 hypothetical protein [Pseudomonadales bacterium]MCP5332964.1 type III-B CRISPR module-associated protein Cmr5 [Pseudomonadales bacterium]HNG17392.1 type III-B CRISPR module-associated protein Cmr5 [Accumulibacter sp.]HNG78641.1 type III-B CRISPR module-associated protein Cmr5 [Burkholderiaceae bacterium]